MDDSLRQFKTLNELRLTSYRNPLSWDLNFEDVAERDGVGIGYNFYDAFPLPYQLTKDGRTECVVVQGDTFPLVRQCRDAYLQNIVSRFEKFSDTPTAYFMYNYLQLVLRWRKDEGKSIQ